MNTLGKSENEKTQEELTDRELFYQRFKKWEIVLSLACAVLISLRFLKIYYPLIILLLAMSFLAILTFLFAYSKDLIYDFQNPILKVNANVACSVLIVGILFCCMIWPGGRLITMVGAFTTLLSIVWIVFSIGHKRYDLSQFYHQALLAKLLFFTFLGIWFSFTPPVEVYKLLSRNGNDPQAVYLYEQHVNDPHNRQKEEAFKAYQNQKYLQRIRE